MERKHSLMEIMEFLSGKLLVEGSPPNPPATVYEILEETVPEPHFYIQEYEVQDVSVKGIKYADYWATYDEENLYFEREEAEAALKRMEE